MSAGWSFGDASGGVGHFPFFSSRGVEEVAEQAEQAARGLEKVGAGLRTVTVTSGLAVDGDLAAPIRAVADRPIGESERLARVALLLSGVMWEWLEVLGQQNRIVARLNQEWESLSSGRGVNAPGLAEQLTQRYAVCVDEVDWAGRDLARSLSADPTDAVLRKYAFAGAVDVAAYERIVHDSSFTRLVIEAIGDHGLPPNVESLTDAQLRAWFEEHPSSVRSLAGLHWRSMHGVVGRIARWMAQKGSDDTAAKVGEALEKLGPQQSRLLVMMMGSLAGNSDNVSFEYRVEANAVTVAAQRVKEQAGLDRVLAQRGEWKREAAEAEREGDGVRARTLAQAMAGLGEQIKRLQGRVDLETSIVQEHRMILYFDPAGDGAIAELHAPITKSTRNVGVLVPGTGTNLSNYDNFADRTRSFQTYGGDSLAMITWLGGDVPDSLTNATSGGYAKVLAPRLAAFSGALEREVARVRSGYRGVEVTVAGHSYGGEVVGDAQRDGLVADRLLMIESAGEGPGIDSLDDLPRAERSRIKRYSITAPTDLIAEYQQTHHGGADPDTFGNTVRLDSGDKANSHTPIRGGLAAHTGVFGKGSDAWFNMYAVFTGGTATAYRRPVYGKQNTAGEVEAAVNPRLPDAIPDQLDRTQTGWAGPIKKINLP